MRSSVVPAQVTTVEDKVAGNLSMIQLMLLFAPIIAGGVIYVVFPPSLGGALYKTALMIVVGLALWILAIRFKGRILLSWAVTIGRYNLRPRYYVFDKNDVYLRTAAPMEDYFAEELADVEVGIEDSPMPVMSFADSAFMEKIMADPKANVNFRTDRKGKLNVRINEDK